MTNHLKFVAITVLTCVAAVAAGQAAPSEENLLVSPPKNFKIGFQSNLGNQQMTEFVPSAESVEDWSQMLTVQVFRHAKIDAAAFLQGVGGRYMNDCPGTTAKGIFTGQINGYVVSMLVLRCPRNPKTEKPETTAFRVIKGADGLYAIQRAWRAVPTDQDFDDAMHDLAKVSVCDTRTTNHPCPQLETAGKP